LPRTNSLLLLLAIGANPFQINPTSQKRAFYSQEQSSSLFAASGLSSQPQRNPDETELQEKPKTPNACNYTDPNGSQVLVPSVGKDFQKLEKEQHEEVIAKLYDISGGFFQYLKHAPDKVDEIMVGSKDALSEYEDIGNCYNFATNTRYNNTYTNLFPGDLKPPLNHTNHQDNIDELDQSMLNQFSNDIHYSKKDAPPINSEQKVTSYISEETFQKDNGETYRDYHLAKKLPDESSYWHKPGGLAAKILDEESVKSGRIKETNTIWLITDNNNIDSDEIGYIEGIGKIDKIRSTSTPAYKECSSFSLKIKQQQSSQEPHSR